MCGINGIVQRSGGQISAETLRHMNQAMIHRGPDDQGLWIDHHAGLSMRRLSIIDLEGASQPMMNEDGSIGMVCNGEIYNYASLREQLLAAGHQFRTNGDVEVILHLYEQYGTECVHHLRGMFAFLIWDSRTSSLFAARDRFGIKPLYYMEDNDVFICSSEISSLLAASPSRPQMDIQSMVYYLTMQYVPDPRTMLANVRKLPPAHILTLKDGRPEVKRYWQPRFNPDSGNDSMGTSKSLLAKRIREALSDSVRHHLASDVPVGCFLSSGIDSTAIAALMQAQSDAPFHTFSIGFEGEHNECVVSRRTAAILKSNHHEWVISEQEYFDMVEECVRYQEDPVADPSAVALYGLSKMASQHVKVVLSGEGADELFGGYGIYREPAALRTVDWMPQPIKRSLRSVIRTLPNFYGKNYLLRASTPLEDRYVGNAKIFTDDVNKVLLQRMNEERTALQTAFQLMKPLYQQTEGEDDITRMQLIDLHFWLPGNILAKADKMSMAHSLELRVPFLDRGVFDAAASVPARYRVHKHVTKYLLREALRDIVPPHVLHRPKLGFPVPLRLWLSGKRGLHCLEAIRASGLSELLNMRYVEQLVALHQDGRADHARKIWCLYILALWFERFAS